MTLTLASGPLAGKPPQTVNYRIEGPAHRLLLHDFPRRVRATLGGETVLDSRSAKLLHETGLLPQLYVPEQDFRAELLEATDHSTHCPFKGDASYHSVRAGDRLAENAVWTYLHPIAAARWLQGHRGVYWDRMDSWFDEDEEVWGNLRDPYHRVDVRRSSTTVRVFAGDTVIAATERPGLLSETGVPNRYYIPREDVRTDLLVPSDRRAVCPYKGESSYWSLDLDGARTDEVGWSYEQPFEAVDKVAGHICFLHDDIVVEVDGRPA